MEEGEIDTNAEDPFELQITMSKQKYIDESKIIFDQSTGREFDYIVNKRISAFGSTGTAGQGQGRRDRSREFRQIVVGSQQVDPHAARMQANKKRMEER